MDATNIILAIIGAGGLTALITHWFNKQKTKAEVEQIMATTYSKIISDLKAQIDNDKEFYTRRITSLETDYQQLRQSLITAEDRNTKYLSMIEGFRASNEELSSENKKLLEETKRLSNLVIRLENKLRDYKNNAHEKINGVVGDKPPKSIEEV